MTKLILIGNILVAIGLLLAFFSNHYNSRAMGNLDVELTIDAVDNKDNFQSFVLFSGDSDFEALLKYLRAYKKNCIVVSTKDHVSIELLRQAKFIELKKMQKEIEIISPSG